MGTRRLASRGKPTMRMVWLGLLALLVIVDGGELRADAEQPLKSSSGSLPLSQAAGEAGAEYLLHPLKAQRELNTATPDDIISEEYALVQQLEEKPTSTQQLDALKAAVAKQKAASAQTLAAKTADLTRKLQSDQAALVSAKK